MKPHPKLRKTIKWGGAAVTVLLVVVWVGSGWYCASYARSDWGWRVESGRISWEQGVFVYQMPLRWGRTRQYGTGKPLPFALRWTVARVRNDFRDSFYYEVTDVPLWMPGVLFGLISGTAWRLDALARRRERVGRCPKCHYDRAGLPAGAVCPECGVANT